MIRKYYKRLLLATYLLISMTGIKAQDNIYVYKDGIVVFKGKAAAVDSVVLEDNKTKLTFYDADNSVLYSDVITAMDSITFAPVKPVADMLDIVFKGDGTVEDISPMKNTVEIVSNNSTLSTYYNGVYGRYVATFENNWGANPSVYCKVDYSDNETFKNALADGHTLEALVMGSYEPPIATGEAKFLASHESGGTGLMSCNASKGLTGNSELCFSAYIGGKFNPTPSGIVPQPDVFYHIVGVWNKEEGKSYIYVNGELKNTVEVSGDFKFPNGGSNWFGIGCDAGPTAQLSWNGEIVLTRIYDAPLKTQEVDALWEEIQQMQEKPQADVLDVVFKTDGTAKDVSPMKNVVTTVASGALSTYYNSTYKRFVVKFENTWAGSTSGYYKVDYANNQAFRNALADGHTLEAVFMGNYEAPIKDGEAKFFSSHERGGTGLMVCKASGERQNEITFLPNVSESPSNTWIWANSGVVPEPQTYYHVVGVWNKEEGKAYIYLNGELKKTADAVGNLNFPAEGSNWLGIGCDAGPSAQLGWNGDVVLARIYDAPLTQQNVAVLWDEVKRMQDKSEPDLVSDIEFYSGAAVVIGGTFHVKGQGFHENDKLHFLSITNEANDVTLNGVVVENSGLDVVIPEGFLTGQYRMMLVRGDKMQDLGLTKVEVVEEFPNPAEVIAHRGYWDTEGSAQNSRTSLVKTQELGLYGSEIDIWLTTDGYIMLNHDETYNGVNIQNSTYAQVKDLTLSNGEKMPQLKDCLDLLKGSNTTKLMIEVKTHSSSARNMAVAQAAINAVTAENLQSKVEYIAFDLDICKELVRLDPNAKVAYLAGGMTPTALHNLGITGIDYHQQEFRDNPQWITEAKNLGMTVNVWTVNSIGDMTEMTNLGVEFITTDKPLDALKVKQYYLDNKE